MRTTDSATSAIRRVALSGAPEAIGRTHGAGFADEIRTYTEERVTLVGSGRWSGGPISRSDVLAIADAMVPAHAAFDRDLHREMEAMASAAGISLPEAIVVGGFTDFVDTVRAVVGGPTPSSVIEDDCTAVLVPDGRADGAGYLAQTWDMHDTATKHVVVLEVSPDRGPAAKVFTTTGCLGQIGMNDAGLCVGINNLTGSDGTIGVTWPSVVRAMLGQTTAREALDVLLGADLAGAHSFLILDREGEGFNVEAMPSARPVVPLEDDAVVHTNHTLDPAASAVQVDRDPPLQENSAARLATARQLLADGDIGTERLFDLLREPTTICQTSHPPYHVESSGAVVMRPATSEFWACWGRPAENDFVSI